MLEGPRPSAIRAAFILQNEMRWLPACKCLEPLPEEDTHTLLVINGERFTTPGAEPEVFDAMAVRRNEFLPWKLLKTEKTSLAVIKIGRAFRMGAFQIHRLYIAAFPMGSNTHLKWKIRFGYRSVKLI